MSFLQMGAHSPLKGIEQNTVKRSTPVSKHTHRHRHRPQHTYTPQPDPHTHPHTPSLLLPNAPPHGMLQRWLGR